MEDLAGVACVVVGEEQGLHSVRASEAQLLLRVLPPSSQ